MVGAMTELKSSEDAVGPSDTEIRIDARPLIAAGREPFSALMAAAARVAPGGVLIVDAPFDPAPLRRLLGGKGFNHAIEQIADDHFRIRFEREAPSEPASAPAVSTDSVGAKLWLEADGAHIDVRGLTPPNPMVAILRLVSQPDCGAVVIVHHEREPVFLFPELLQRGWSYEAVPAPSPEVRYRLRREAR
jgi:hypothetical protein